MGVSNIKSNPTGSVQWEFELGENLVAADPIYIYDDSGAKVKKVYSSLDQIDDFCRGYYHYTTLIDADRIVVAYRDLADGGKGKVICGTIQGDNTVVWGTPVEFYSGYAYNISISKMETGKFVVVARGASNYAYAWVGTAAANVITIGVAQTINAATSYDVHSCRIAENKFVAVYRDAGALNHGVARVGEVAGYGVTFGTEAAFKASSTYYPFAIRPGVDNKFIVAYRAVSGTTKGLCCCSTVTGTGIDGFGAEVEFNTASASHICGTDIDTNKFMIVYRDDGDGNKLKAIIGTSLVGTAIVIDTADETLINNVTTYYPSVCKMATDDVRIAYCHYVTPYRGQVVSAVVSGTAISAGIPQTFACDRAYYINVCRVDTDKYALIWYDYKTALSDVLVVEGDLNLLSYTMGLMQESGSIGEIKPIDLLGGISEQLSGMTPGDIQYIQCDASISEVKSDYPIGISLATDKMLIHKTPFGA